MIRVDLVVHLAVDEQQLAREPVREVQVGGAGPGLGVVRAVVGLHEALVEVGGVVRAGEGDAGLEHLGELQYRPHCRVAAAGVAEDARPVQVHPRPGLGQLSQCRDVVGQVAGVGQPAVGSVVEGLVAPGGAPTVECDHDEAQCGEGFGVHAHAARVEGRQDPVDLRAGVDVVHHGIALGGVEAARVVQHAVDVGDAVSSLDAEALGRGPAGRGELRRVGALQLDQDPSGPVADAGHRRGVDGGRGVEEVLLAVRQGDDVVRLVVGEPGEAGAVQADPTHRAPVRILLDQA